MTNIDIVLAEKCFKFKLPATHSAFQQARRSALHRSVLRRDAIFGYKKTDSLQDSAKASCPCGEGRDRREEPTNHLHTCMEGKEIEICDFLEWVGGSLGGDHQAGCGHGGRGFDTR